jgi:hypothetical protein
MHAEVGEGEGEQLTRCLGGEPPAVVTGMERPADLGLTSASWPALTSRSPITWPSCSIARMILSSSALICVAAIRSAMNAAAPRARSGSAGMYLTTSGRPR